MASRKLEDLVPELETKARTFITRCHDAGLMVMITCTSRTRIEQTALYAMGREDTASVNVKRKAAGLTPIMGSENRKVTWTLESRHIVEEPGDKARAFDFALSIIGPKFRPYWELKFDVNANDIPDYIEAGKIAEACGLVWGGRWQNSDYPHCQLPG